MAKKKTHKEYLEELFLKEIDFDPVEQYAGAKSKILHECVEGHRWAVTPTNILSGKGCPYCDAVDTDKYVKKLKLVNPSIVCLEEYIKTAIPILHKHLYCSYEWKARPHDILLGGGCPKCNGSMLKSEDTYRAELEQTEFILVGNYISTRVAVTHKHKLCDYEWKVTPQNILAGSGCPNCSSSGLKTNLPCKVYFVEFTYNKTTYFKIGITQRKISDRFQGDWNKFNMKVLWELTLANYHEAKVIESNILNEHRVNKINTGLLHSGNTETFNIYIEKPNYENL